MADLDQSELKKAATEIQKELRADPNVSFDPCGTVTVTLSEPFTYAEERIEKVVLSRPKGKHMKKFIKDDDQLELVEAVGNIPSGAWDEMDAADLMIAIAVGASFLEKRRKTGESA